jgi:hypothetical protein
MDGGALAALGLAANILQFIDWVSHVLDIGSQIRRNGMSDFQIGLEKTAKELRHHVARIKTPPGLAACPSQNDQVSTEMMVGLAEPIWMKLFAIESYFPQNMGTDIKLVPGGHRK